MSEENKNEETKSNSGSPVDARQIVDFWRQLALFNPQLFDIPVTVVGVGATGSHIVDSLANMGVSKLTVYDFDLVEGHNLPNQIFGIRHVGIPKVEALKLHVKEKVGIDIEAKNEKVETLKDLSGVLILCTDSMECQKKIFLSSARLNRKVKLVIETRMGLEQGRVFSFDPNDKGHIQKYASCHYSDKDALESPCNARAIATTVKVIAGIAAHRIVLLNKYEEALKKGDRIKVPLYNETLVGTDGNNMVFDW